MRILLCTFEYMLKIHDFTTPPIADAQTSALDVYVVPANPTWIQRLWPKLLWYAGILGGWFIHSGVNKLFCCFQCIARNVSPAFKGWTFRDQISRCCRLSHNALHILISCSGDFTLWVYRYCIHLVYLPLYTHCNCTSITIGLLWAPAHSFMREDQDEWLSWWLLNLNEHDTHHQQRLYGMPCQKAINHSPLSLLKIKTYRPTLKGFGSIQRPHVNRKMIIRPATTADIDAMIDVKESLAFEAGINTSTGVVSIGHRPQWISTTIACGCVGYWMDGVKGFSIVLPDHALHV